MSWLNYQHLFYFWLITREGGVARAAHRLRLTHSTLSTQLRLLEEYLGNQLFERRGKRLLLTPLGTQVAAYADDIFRLGAELVDTARGENHEKQSAFKVGVVGNLPKSVIYKLIVPALESAKLSPLQLRQNTLARLVEELAGGRLHLILSDTPPEGTMPYKLHAHPLGEIKTFLYGSRALAKKYGKDFPEKLDGAPLLLPAVGGLRRAMELWFAARELRLQVVGEFEDAGTMRVFGGEGLGLFPVREGLHTEVEESHGAIRLGVLEGVFDRYYAISMERKIKHPGVAAIVEHARLELEKGKESTRKKTKK
jgi:LysR family transcriptional activator of nhaA